MSCGDLSSLPTAGAHRAKPGGQHQYRHRRPARRPGVIPTQQLEQAESPTQAPQSSPASFSSMHGAVAFPRSACRQMPQGEPLSARRAWSDGLQSYPPPAQAAGFGAARTGAAGVPASFSSVQQRAQRSPHRPAARCRKGEPLGASGIADRPPGRRPALHHRASKMPPTRWRRRGRGVMANWAGGDGSKRHGTPDRLLYASVGRAHLPQPR